MACAEECEGFWIEARMRPEGELAKQQALVAILRSAARLHVVWKRKGHDLPARILVDSAVAHLGQQSHRGAVWLEEASIADEAEVLLRAVDRVDRFQRDFPEWPIATPVRVEAISAQVGEGLRLVGNPDLAFGAASRDGDGLLRPWAATLTFWGPEESERRVETRVRFDQLVETLRFGGPPTESLIWDPESGEITRLVADPASLDSAAIGAALAALSLRKIIEGGRLSLNCGEACRLCPLTATCGEFNRD